MKKILVILMAFLLNACASMQIKIDNVKSNVNYEYKDGSLLTDNQKIFKEKSEIMVRFNKETPELISQFESKYDLELIKVLTNGFYIYKTNINTIDKINLLIDEKNIKSVFPAWSKLYRKM